MCSRAACLRGLTFLLALSLLAPPGLTSDRYVAVDGTATNAAPAHPWGSGECVGTPDTGVDDDGPTDQTRRRLLPCLCYSEQKTKEIR